MVNNFRLPSLAAVSFESMINPFITNFLLMDSPDSAHRRSNADELDCVMKAKPSFAGSCSV